MKKGNITGKIALGVTGVVLTAGAVTAGAAALSKKKKHLTLKDQIDRAAKEVERVRGAIEEGRKAYSASAPET